jgi:hypothetical protein
MRTHVRLSLAASALLVGQLTPRAQEPAKPQGIFISAPDAAAQPRVAQLHAIMVTDIKQKGLMKIMLTQGHAKGSTEGTIPGAAAAVRTQGGDISFEFHFDENAGKPATQDLDEAMKWMSGESLPRGATSADTFVLVHLHVAKGARSLDLGTMGGQGNAAPSKDAVAISTQAVGLRTFKVQPKEPLEPGEYAFYWNGNGKGFGGQLWDFGVDGK